MSQLELLNVRLAGPPPARVRDHHIDAPEPGLASGVVRLEGWIVPAKGSVTGVVAFCQGALLRAAPLDMARADVAERYDVSPLCGFATSISVLELPPKFEITLCAVFEDHEQLPLAIIEGRHGNPLSPGASGLQPLMLTSLGRSGTTLLMKLLAGHRQIVADRTYPYEANAASYWMHLLRVITRGETPNVIPPTFDQGDWTQPPFAPPPTYRTPALAAYLADGYEALAANFCRDSTDAFYRQIAAKQGQPDPVYFCEKLLPSGLCIMFHNLYPQTKEMFLVRDFRDVLCSILAFNAKRGLGGFGRDQVASDEQFVPELRKAVRSLLDAFRARGDGAYLVRYEDLILRPRDTLAGILDYLNLDADEAALEAMMHDDPQDASRFKVHRTSTSAESSIGRWQHDLAPGMQRLARKAFDSLLPGFGYALDRDGRLVMDQPEAHTLAARGS